MKENNNFDNTNKTRKALVIITLVLTLMAVIATLLYLFVFDPRRDRVQASSHAVWIPWIALLPVWLINLRKNNYLPQKSIKFYYVLLGFGFLLLIATVIFLYLY